MSSPIGKKPEEVSPDSAGLEPQPESAPSQTAHQSLMVDPLSSRFVQATASAPASGNPKIGGALFRPVRPAIEVFIEKQGLQEFAPLIRRYFDISPNAALILKRAPYYFCDDWMSPEGFPRVVKQTTTLINLFTALHQKNVMVRYAHPEHNFTHRPLPFYLVKRLWESLVLHTEEGYFSKFQPTPSLHLVLGELRLTYLRWLIETGQGERWETLGLAHQILWHAQNTSHPLDLQNPLWILLPEAATIPLYLQEEAIDFLLKEFKAAARAYADLMNTMKKAPSGETPSRGMDTLTAAAKVFVECFTEAYHRIDVLSKNGNHLLAYHALKQIMIVHETTYGKWPDDRPARDENRAMHLAILYEQLVFPGSEATVEVWKKFSETGKSLSKIIWITGEPKILVEEKPQDQATALDLWNDLKQAWFQGIAVSISSGLILEILEWVREQEKQAGLGPAVAAENTRGMILAVYQLDRNGDTPTHIIGNLVHDLNVRNKMGNQNLASEIDKLEKHLGPVLLTYEEPIPDFEELAAEQPLAYSGAVKGYSGLEPKAKLLLTTRLVTSQWLDSLGLKDPNRFIATKFVRYGAGEVVTALGLNASIAQELAHEIQKRKLKEKPVATLNLALDRAGALMTALETLREARLPVYGRGLSLTAEITALMELIDTARYALCEESPPDAELENRVNLLAARFQAWLPKKAKLRSSPTLRQAILSGACNDRNAAEVRNIWHRLRRDSKADLVIIRKGEAYLIAHPSQKHFAARLGHLHAGEHSPAALLHQRIEMTLYFAKDLFLLASHGLLDSPWNAIWNIHLTVCSMLTQETSMTPEKRLKPGGFFSIPKLLMQLSDLMAFGESNEENLTRLAILWEARERLVLLKDKAGLKICLQKIEALKNVCGSSLAHIHSRVDLAREMLAPIMPVLDKLASSPRNKTAGTVETLEREISNLMRLGQYLAAQVLLELFTKARLANKIAVDAAAEAPRYQTLEQARKMQLLKQAEVHELKNLLLLETVPTRQQTATGDSTENWPIVPLHPWRLDIAPAPGSSRPGLDIVNRSGLAVAQRPAMPQQMHSVTLVNRPVFRPLPWSAGIFGKPALWGRGSFSARIR